MNDYLIIGSPSCGYCNNAKQLLESKGKSYNYVMMNELTSSEVTQYEATAGAPFRTVPQIFEIDGDDLKYVGGFSELAQSFRG
jgi:glutaredoxin